MRPRELVRSGAVAGHRVTTRVAAFTPAFAFAIAEFRMATKMRIQPVCQKPSRGRARIGFTVVSVWLRKSLNPAPYTQA